MTSRRFVRGFGVLAAILVGWSQSLPAAEAGFSSAASASPTVATRTLGPLVLTCDPGGLLVSSVTLRWPSTSDATTLDTYATPANSSYLADGFEVYRSVNNGVSTLLASPARTDTSYVDSPGGLVTTYRYTIRTKKQGWTGSFSNAVTASVTSVLFVGISTMCS